MDLPTKIDIFEKKKKKIPLKFFRIRKILLFHSFKNEFPTYLCHILITQSPGQHQIW